MNMRTEVVEVDNIGGGMESNINKVIARRREVGWYLRGIPVTLDENRVLLTFETPEKDEEIKEFSKEFPD